MLNDPLANAMSTIQNAENLGRADCTVKPVSKIIKKVLEIMQQSHYLGSYEALTESRGGTLKVNLLGYINKCGAIKPRYSLKKEDFEKFEKRYLPAKDFGILIVSTPKGMMTHTDAKAKKLGGTLIAYCY